MASNLFSYTITGLTAGQSYYVNVRAQNTLGLGAPLEMDRPHLARSPFTKPGMKFFPGNDSRPWPCTIFDHFSHSLYACFFFKISGKPRGHIRVLDCNKSTVTIAWDHPEDDGGSAIMNYHIERRETNLVTWVPVMSVRGSITTTTVDLCPIDPVPCHLTEHKQVSSNTFGNKFMLIY